jgi:transposase
MNPRKETSADSAARFMSERQRRASPKRTRSERAAGRRLDSRWRRFQAISLTMLDGLCARDVATMTGLSHANVAQVLSRAGVHSAPYEPLRDAKATVTMAVAQGACIVDAAAVAGISLGTVHKALLARGIRGKATNAGRIDGRSRRAAARVLFEGASGSQASRAERCSTAATSKMIQSVRERLR